MGDDEGDSGKSKKSSDQTLDWAKFTWEAFKGIIAGAAAVFAFFANQQSTKNSEALDKLKIQSEERAQQTALDIKVFELLEKTLSLEGPAAKGHGLAAAAIINALTGPPLRDGFLNALYAASKDEALLKQLDEAKEFDAGTVDTVPPPDTAPVRRGSRLEGVMPRIWDAIVPSLSAQSQFGALKGYRIDVFYCEASVSNGTTENRRKRAQSAADSIKKATGGDVTPSVRLLPTLVQARPEYRSVADEIRYDDEPRETEVARLLSKLLNIRPENLRKVNAARTANYISLFYCG